MLLLVSGLNGDNTGRKDAPIQEGNVFSRVCPSVCSCPGGGRVPPYMALAQGLLFMCIYCSDLCYSHSGKRSPFDAFHR